MGGSDVSSAACQALEELQQKRMADQAFFRDMIKRQKRCLDQLKDET